MTDERIPSILVIDDIPEEVSALGLALEPVARVRIRHPDDITDRGLAEADLVLIDYRLRDWPGRNEVPQVSLKPKDGLALAALIRSRLRELHPSTAIALHSAHLGDIMPFSRTRRPHIIAHAANIEWAFPKEAETTALVRSIASLARAAMGVTELKGDADGASFLNQVLAVPAAADWEHDAVADAESCLPPAYELLEAFGDLALLRWLLHRILPYPCFLWDSRTVALRLRTTVEWVEQHLRPNEPLWTWLEPSRYTGELSDFLGNRWWRVGIEQKLWEATEGAAFDVKSLHGAVSRAIGEAIDPTPVANPTIALGPTLEPLDEFIPFEKTVRIQPDDWPAFAEPALVSVEDAKEELLARLVVDRDRWKLQ